METEKNKLEKPRVWGLVGILLLRGLLLAWQFITNWQFASDPLYADVLPGWFMPFVILLGVLAVLCLAGSGLIFMYKRYGLWAAIIASAIDLVAGVLLLVAGQLTLALPTVLGFLISGSIIYYSWKYLNEEPHSAFFS
jgi:hypothetical protein